MRPGESQVARKLHVTPEEGTWCHTRVRKGERVSVVKEGLRVTVSGWVTGLRVTRETEVQCDPNTIKILNEIQTWGRSSERHERREGIHTTHMERCWCDQGGGEAQCDP